MKLLIEKAVERLVKSGMPEIEAIEKVTTDYLQMLSGEKDIEDLFTDEEIKDRFINKN